MMAGDALFLQVASKRAVFLRFFYGGIFAGILSPYSIFS